MSLSLRRINLSFIIDQELLGGKWGYKGYGLMPYDCILKNLALDFWSLLDMDWVDSKQFGI
ncbi:MAG TPA: hypothetical protein VIK55_09185 [Paludibacter sp.]